MPETRCLADALDRIHSAVHGHQRGVIENECVVQRQDLLELLHHYSRLDRSERAEHARQEANNKASGAHYADVASAAVLQKSRSLAGTIAKLAKDSGNPDVVQDVAECLNNTVDRLHDWLRRSTGGVYPRIRAKDSPPNSGTDSATRNG